MSIDCRFANFSQSLNPVVKFHFGSKSLHKLVDLSLAQLSTSLFLYYCYLQLPGSVCDDLC